VKIRVLGCHGSDGLLHDEGIAHSCHTCGFLLNDTVLLDAGTVASKLSMDAQAHIRHVLLSHLHFDHIKGLPTLADNLSERFDAPIAVAGIQPVIQGLRDHIFNGSVYPDFFAIPAARPVLTPLVLRLDELHTLSGLTVRPISVNHTVPTTGFIISDAASAFLYSGDTASTDDLWRIANRTPHLRAVFVECSYPDGMHELARMSKHLTPHLLAQELKKLSRLDLPIYVYHLKPNYKAAIRRELEALTCADLRILEEGQILEF